MRYLFAFALLFLACNPTKKIERKDNAAIERVTAKRNLIDRVAPYVFAIYPCANDSTWTSETDTIKTLEFYPLPIPIWDSCPELFKDTTNFKVKDGKPFLKKQTKQINTKETAVVTDKTKLDLLEKKYSDSINHYKAIALKESQNAENNLKQAVKFQNQRNMYLIGLIALFLLVCALIYILIKSRK